MRDVPLDVHARLDADRTVEPSAVPAPVRPAGARLHCSVLSTTVGRKTAGPRACHADFLRT
ncbi:hypothetical protein [Streptomyces sp. NPDC093991]|uniref:hypothetical protein n=1 Tax=unclassified Streptomyces TaxID=2593676 RepID=UPI00341445CB